MQTTVNRSINARLRWRLARRVSPAPSDVHNFRIGCNVGKRVDFAGPNRSPARSDRQPPNRCRRLLSVRREVHEEYDECTAAKNDGSIGSNAAAEGLSI